MDCALGAILALAQLIFWARRSVEADLPPVCAVRLRDALPQAKVASVGEGCLRCGTSKRIDILHRQEISVGISCGVSRNLYDEVDALTGVRCNSSEAHVTPRKRCSVLIICLRLDEVRQIAAVDCGPIVLAVEFRARRVRPCHFERVAPTTARECGSELRVAGCREGFHLRRKWRSHGRLRSEGPGRRVDPDCLLAETRLPRLGVQLGVRVMLIHRDCRATVDWAFWAGCAWTSIREVHSL